MPTGGSYSASAPPGGTSVLRAAGRPRASRDGRRGAVRYGPTTGAGLAVLGGQLGYHVYANTGAGDPINYSLAVAATNVTTWTSTPLAAPGTWTFGIRSYDGHGEEANLDCAVAIVLDALGNDITNRPSPPVGLRAFATPGASIRVEWSYPPTRGPAAPTGFNVYIGTGGTPSYSSPAATVAFSTGILSTFICNLPGLSGGTTYSIGVRAYNAVGEETNAVVVSVIADADGPAAVDSLVVTPIV